MQTIGEFHMADELDKDGELEVSLRGHGGGQSTGHIDKTMALQFARSLDAHFDVFRQLSADPSRDPGCCNLDCVDPLCETHAAAEVLDMLGAGLPAPGERPVHLQQIGRGKRAETTSSSSDDVEDAELLGHGATRGEIADIMNGHPTSYIIEKARRGEGGRSDEVLLHIAGALLLPQIPAEHLGFAAECAMEYGAEPIGDDDAEVFVITRDSLVQLMFAMGYRHRVD